jgi:hypothetical protein
MLFILFVGTLAVMAAVLGLSMCRAAAHSDRESAVDLTEWVAKGRHPGWRDSGIDSVGEQLRLVPSGKSFREAG